MPAGRAGRPGDREGQGKAPSSGVRSSGGINADRNLIETLSNSKVFQEYERAFAEATGLPVALRAVESWQLGPSRPAQ